MNTDVTSPLKTGCSIALKDCWVNVDTPILPETVT